MFLPLVPHSTCLQRNVIFLLKGIETEIYSPSTGIRDKCQVRYQGVPSSEDPKNLIRRSSTVLEGEGTAGMQRRSRRNTRGLDIHPGKTHSIKSI